MYPSIKTKILSLPVASSILVHFPYPLPRGPVLSTLVLLTFYSYSKLVEPSHKGERQSSSGFPGRYHRMKLVSCKFFRSETFPVKDRRTAIAGLRQNKQSGFFRIPTHIILHHQRANSGQYLAVLVLRQQSLEAGQFFCHPLQCRIPHGLSPLHSGESVPVARR